MPRLAWIPVFAALLAGCAGSAAVRFPQYAKYDPLCRDYARQVTAVVNEESRYQECMAYHIPPQPTFPVDSRFAGEPETMTR